MSRAGIWFLLFLSSFPLVGVGWAEDTESTDSAKDASGGLLLYIREKETSLRTNPSLSAELVDLLDYGTELRQLNRRGRWFEVATSEELRGWITSDSASRRSPILPPGYEQAEWGQSRAKILELTGAADSGARLIREFAEGPLESVAYNFNEDRLFFVEVRYRIPSGVEFDDYLARAMERFGRPHHRDSRKWMLPSPQPGEEIWMQTLTESWQTGETGFALVSYAPLYEDGPTEVRAEYWSTRLAGEMGLEPQQDVLEGIEF